MKEDFIMRGFREVERIIERDERNKREEEERYRHIKPKTNITFEEAKTFIESLFAPMGDE